MNVLLICGSIAERSHTRALLNEVADTLNLQSVAVTTWDPRLDPLPIADPSFHSAPNEYPDANVRRFIATARSADGFVLASPLYHGSFSGVLKNALDHLWYDAFRNKPVALISHGANDRKCAQPATALQQVVSTLFGYCVQTQIATCKTDYSYHSDGNPTLTNADVKTRVQRLAEELVRLMAVLK